MMEMSAQSTTAADDLRSGFSAIPLFVLTGFLGSGKTTLLNRLLRDPQMAGCVVIVNEIGEVGLDHFVVRQVSEHVVLLSSGCLCCVVRSDLVHTLRELFVQRIRKEIPPFRRVVVETTGLADPVPILHTFLTDPFLLERYQLEGMLAAVDACHGEAQIAAYPEALKQVLACEHIVLTKLDLVRAEIADRLRRTLGTLNPGARLLDGRTELPLLRELSNAAMCFAETTRWREAHASLPPAGHSAAEHSEGIGSFCLRSMQPLIWEDFSSWLNTQLTRDGERILRVKGILDVAGQTKPLLINGVHHVFYPATELAAWPGAGRQSDLVFIGRDLDAKAIRESFDAMATANRRRDW